MTSHDRFVVNTETLDHEMLDDKEKGIASSFRKVIKETIIEIIDHVKKAIFDNDGDNSIYKGRAGIALLLLHFNNIIGHFSDGHQYSISNQYFTSVKSHDSISFIMGQVGVDAVHFKSCALESDKTCSKMTLFPISPFSTRSDNYELLYGYSGYLYALHYLSFSHYEKEIRRVVDLIFKEGSKADKYDYFPLMYTWHSTLYLGPAHGMFGILCMLSIRPEILSKEQVGLIKKTVMKLITDEDDTRYSPSGNFKSSVESGKSHDKLVQWCHGAPGVAISLGYLVEKKGLEWTSMEKEKIIKVMEKMAQITWERGLLKKGIGLCHGVGGNGYAFLTAYKITGNSEYLLKALAFAKYIIRQVKEGKYGGDNSLFDGNGGGAYFLIDLLNHNDYKGFPAFTDI